MVVHDGHLGGAVLRPSEDDPPLLVDADRMEAGQLAFQGLQAVAGRHGQIGELPGPVHLDQLAQGHPGDGIEAPILLLPEQLLGVRIGEGLDHEVMEEDADWWRANIRKGQPIPMTPLQRG